MFRMVLFGVPHLYVDTTDLSKVITGRSLALLVYLAVTGKNQDRNILADLLWDNLSEAQAKKNLRYVLYDLRRAIGDYLLVSRHTIAFQRHGHYWLDVEVFSSYLQTEKPTTNVELYQEVIDLYQGEFLDGFYIQDAPIFEEWLAGRRQQLHTQVVHGLHLLAQEYIEQRNYEQGLQMTQRLLTLEPWNEEAHRQQMRLLAYSGRRSAALAQYEACRRALTTEYSAEPLVETTQIYEAIKAGRFAKPTEKPRGARLSAGYRQPVAAQPTTMPLASGATLPAEPPLLVNWDAIPVPPRLFGRTPELARLEQWICNDGVRLIGLSGLSGQGKSALAAELVRRLADATEDQALNSPHHITAQTSQDFAAIFWCSLAGVSSCAQLIAYWWRWCGAELGLNDPTWVEQAVPLEEQLAELLRYLRQQRCLLVFDQVEAVLQPELFTGAYRQGWELFPELLRRVAESEHQSCLLIISREELPEFTYLTRNTSAVRTLVLQGLAIADSVAMLRSHGLTDDESILADLVQQYAGLPLGLICVGAMSQCVPKNHLSTLLGHDIPLFDDLHRVFEQQVKRISVLEHELLFWLAIEQTAVSFDHFWQTFTGSGTKGQRLDAYQSLVRRSLLQVDAIGHMVKLSPLVFRYIVQELIDVVVTELMMVWSSIACAPSSSTTHLPAYTGKLKNAIPHYAISVLEAIESSYAPYPDPNNERQALLQPFPAVEQLAPVAEQAIGHERPGLPFTLLRRYRLVNPDTTVMVAKQQNNCILFPIVEALHTQWGIRVTHQRLQELLEYLLQDFAVDLTIAEYNLRRLLACLEFTEQYDR